jgi:PAS domain S-box-containing protein
VHSFLQHFTNAGHRVAAALHFHHKSNQHAHIADALVRSEERLRLAMEATNFGTFEWDVTENRVRYSPNVKRLFGFSTQTEVTLEDVLARVHPEDREPVQATMRKALDPSGPRTYAGEFRTVLADGSIAWIDGRGAVIFSRGGKQARCMVGIVIDITERREREMQLRRDAAELGASNRMKDEFMATLAHELRNPLAPIRNGLEILAVEGLRSPHQRHACDVMRRQVNHIVHLVDDLLDVSRIHQSKLRLKQQIVPVQQLIENAVEALQAEIEATGHDLQVSLPAEPVLLNVDPVRIVQAIENLLSNSARYTPAGGHIEVRAGLANGGIEIRVIDNGIGIKPDLLPRLFDMFTQDAEHRSESGLGIGLALTKALIELHAGKIQAHSAGAGTGSTFCIWLPVAHHPEAIGRSNVTGIPTIGPRRRILVVDDNADTADSTVALLGLMGHEVHAARNGLQAIEAAQRLSPDIILMDIGMPGLDGNEAARRIRSASPSTAPAIVAVTGWDPARLHQDADEMLFDRHLIKPVDPKSLAKVLRELPGTAERSGAVR